MRARVVEFERPGLILRGRWNRRFTIAYGEILTAERLRGARGLRLHTRTVVRPVRVRARSLDGTDVEAELRRRSVRIVDGWGAIIAPSVSEMEAEFVRGPTAVRQSSDDA